MKGGKLFQLLKSLTPEEFKEFKKVVRSPIFNTNDRLLLLYDQLAGRYPDFDITDKDKKKLYGKIWRGEIFNNYKIHRLFSQMTQVLEEYLLLLEQRQNDLERKKSLVRIYGQRHLLPFFEKETRDLTKALDLSPFKDLAYYQNQIFVKEAIYFHPLNDKYDLKDHSLDQLMNSLDHYFALAKMRYGVSLKSRERILAKPVNWRFMDIVKKEQGQGFMDQALHFPLYQQALILLEEDAEVHFEKYENLLFENINQLGIDRKILFFSGLNYINRQVNKGQSHFSPKALEWYQFGLYNGLLIENKQLSEVTFGNIVIFGCREKAFTWTREFMNAYQHLLDPAQREDVVTYHRGLWHFYQQEFEAAFSLLLNYTFIPAYFLKSRLTAIRAVFEKFIVSNAYYDLLIHQIQAFEMAIRRSKAFSNSTKEPVLNFLSIIKSLSNRIWNHKISPSFKERLVKDLNTSKKITAKEWLIEKINQV